MRHRIIALLCFIVLAACGGGGGGGGPPVALAVQVTYPPPAADAEGALTKGVVTGRIEDLGDGIVDPTDVRTVTVNGVPATLDPLDPSRWSALVPLGSGTNTLDVEVISRSGNRHAIAHPFRNQLTLDQPHAIAVDPVGSVAYVYDAGLAALLAVDLETGVYRSVSDANGLGTGPFPRRPGRASWDARTQRVLLTDEGLDNGLGTTLLPGHFFAIDPVTGDRSLLSSSASSVGTGVSTSKAAAVVADPVEPRSYAVAEADYVLLIDEATGNRSQLSVMNPRVPPYLSASLDLALDVANDRILVLNGGASRTVVAVSLSDGSREMVSEYQDAVIKFSEPVAMAFDPAEGYALVADTAKHSAVSFRRFPRIIGVDLATGDRWTLSGPDFGAGVEFCRTTDLDFDIARNRVLVADPELGAVVAVDLDSGDRSVLAGRDPFLPRSSRGVAVDETGGLLYVLKSDTDTIHTLDLATRELVLVSGEDRGAGPEFASLSDVVLDSEGGRLLVVTHGQGLVEVDLTTGDRRVISGFDGAELPGSGPELTTNALVPDLEANRVFVCDTWLGVVMAIDLTTGHRTVVSDATTGIGPALVEPLDLAYDGESGVLYVPCSNRTVLAVDVETGDRSIASDNVIDPNSPRIPPTTELSIDFDRRRGRLVLATLAGLVEIDPVTGLRAYGSEARNKGAGPGFSGSGVNHVTIDHTGDRAFVVDRNYIGIFVVDLGSGDRSVVLK